MGLEVLETETKYKPIEGLRRISIREISGEGLYIIIEERNPNGLLTLYGLTNK